MRTRAGKWLEVEERPSPSGKTTIFALFPIDAVKPIGFIGWYGPWRKYALQPEPETVYESTCLREIAAFCEAKTAEHKARRKS